MKIAYLSTFYPFRGGIAQFNASLFRVLEKQHDVKAFTFKRQYPNILFPGETQYVTIDDNADKIDSTPLLDTVNPLSYRATASKINQYAPDLLITKFWMPFFAPSLGSVAKRMKPNTKTISILDNVIPHEKRFVDKALIKYFLKQNDGFIAMSQTVKSDLLSLKPNANVLLQEHPYYNHFGDKIPPQQAKEALKIDQTKKTILFFGFIRDYKGLDLLIDAFDKLDNSYQLIIAGECYGSFDKYQAQIDASTRKEDIHIHNHYIGDDDVPNYFCAADVCVLPYKSATQSGITAISHHFEIPIIATNVGGLEESVKDNINGLIVETPNASSISDSINTYFTKELKELFTKAIIKTKKENSWEAFGDKVINFADELTIKTSR